MELWENAFQKTPRTILMRAGLGIIHLEYLGGNDPERGRLKKKTLLANVY